MTTGPVRRSRVSWRPQERARSRSLPARKNRKKTDPSCNASGDSLFACLISREAPPPRKMETPESAGCAGTNVFKLSFKGNQQVCLYNEGLHVETNTCPTLGLLALEGWQDEVLRAVSPSLCSCQPVAPAVQKSTPQTSGRATLRIHQEALAGFDVHGSASSRKPLWAYQGLAFRLL